MTDVVELLVVADTEIAMIVVAETTDTVTDLPIDTTVVEAAVPEAPRLVIALVPAAAALHLVTVLAVLLLEDATMTTGTLPGVEVPAADPIDHPVNRSGITPTGATAIVSAVTTGPEEIKKYLSKSASNGGLLCIVCEVPKDAIRIMLYAKKTSLFGCLVLFIILLLVPGHFTFFYKIYRTDDNND